MIVACNQCKWIGTHKGLLTAPYNVYTGGNTIPVHRDIPCCPNCNAVYLLIIEPIGILNFLKIYLFE